MSSWSSRLHNGLHKRAFLIVPNTYAYFALFVHCQTGASLNINLSCVCSVPLIYQTIWVYPIVLIVLYGLNECASVIKSRFIPLRTMGYTKMGRLPKWLVNKESESNRRVVSFHWGMWHLRLNESLDHSAGRIVIVNILMNEFTTSIRYKSDYVIP